MRKILIAASALLLLAGCSAEPSKAQMEKAVGDNIKAQFEQARTIARAMGGERVASQMPEFPGFASFEKIACKEITDKPGFNCDMKYQVLATDAAKQMSMRFVKGDDGWTATDN